MWRATQPTVAVPRERGEVRAAVGRGGAAMDGCRHWWVASALVGLLLAACTSGAVSETTPTPEPSAVESTSAESAVSASEPEEVVDHSALLVERLGDPGFSARFTLTGFEEQPAGRTERSGGGAIVGDDSELWVVDDFTGLNGAVFAGGPLGVIGPGGRTVRTLASKLVDGVLYTKDHRGHWHESDDADPDTQPGHLFEALRTVDTFEVVGSEMHSGTEYVALGPAVPVNYDPARLSVTAALEADFSADTTIVVDELGTPVRVTLEVEVPEHDYTFMATYDLADVGNTLSVEAPAETWVSATSLGFHIADLPDLDAIDFEIPSSWQTSSTDGALLSAHPQGPMVLFMSVPDPEADPAEGLQLIAEANGIDLDEIMETDLHGLPSQLGTGTTASGFGMAFSQSTSSVLLFLAAWLGPAVEEELQMRQFTEVLHTVEWRNPKPGLVPGNTQGGAELRADARSVVTTVAAVAAGGGCETAEVLWTDVTGARWPEWTEDWYVDACGDLQVHEVTFAGTADGGTDINLTSTPMRFADATSMRLPDGLAEDPALAAALLGEQPWLVDPASELSEVDVAMAVEASQLRESRLHVLVLGSSLGGSFEDYAEEVFTRLGGGTLLVIDAEAVLALSDVDPYWRQVEKAQSEAIRLGTSVQEIVSEFVIALHPNATGLD